MSFQTTENKLPTTDVVLRHGILVNGKRCKIARIRLTLASDRKDLEQIQDSAIRNWTYAAKWTTFPESGRDITSPDMIGALSDSDYNKLFKTASDWDEIAMIEDDLGKAENALGS